jgi:acyl carrier protein
MTDTLLQLFSEVLGIPAEKLNDNSSPDNTSQWDSLAAMHLVAAIESKYSIRLSTKEIMKMASIGLTRTILKAKNLDL